MLNSPLALILLGTTRLHILIMAFVFQTELPLTINAEATAQQNVSPDTQEILNLAAKKYLTNIDPSTPEEFNGFVQYLCDVRKVLIVSTDPGSLIITVKCGSLQILEDLWNDYCSGYLNEMAQKYLVTEEILETLGLVEVKLTTTIPIEKYLECKKLIMVSMMRSPLYLVFCTVLLFLIWPSIAAKIPPASFSLVYECHS